MALKPTDSSADATTATSAPTTNQAASAHQTAAPSPHYQIPPLLTARAIGHITALPPTAQATELAKRANTFASSSKNIFVHYVEPILNHRRTELLSRGKNRKKFTKSAVQLWQGLQEQQYEE